MGKKTPKKNRSKKQKKALKAASIKKSEKRKSITPTTFEDEAQYLHPEKRSKFSEFSKTKPFSCYFDQSYHETSAESAEDSSCDENEDGAKTPDLDLTLFESVASADGCPVECKEKELELEQAGVETELDESVALPEESTTLSEESVTASQFEFEIVEEENGEKRMKRELKCIRKYLISELQNIYRANEFGPFHPKPEDLEDFEEVPKCPVNENRVERKGKRGRIPKAKPRCQYCDLELLDDYHLYDHYSRRLNPFTPIFYLSLNTFWS